jgi:tRNA pseudouridine55 synthase
MLGLLLVDKAAGPSSHDVVERARKVLGVRRAGHAGTLDPQATGLLVIAIGEATRWLPYLPSDKRYAASLRLGLETDTEDIWGKTLAEKDASGLEEEEIRRALEGLKHETAQVPPMVSALKYNGKPLYEYARQGVVLEREARPLEIYELKVLAARPNGADFELHCGSGTYVRSLCAEVGRKLGLGGCLSALRRLSVGPFKVEDAVGIERISAAALRGPSDALGHLPEMKVQGEDEKALGQGRDLELESGDYREDEPWRLSSEDGRLLAFGSPKRQGQAWRMHPERVFARP